MVEPFALIFDMDGVLADTEALIARASIEMYRELYGLELAPEDFRPYIGTGAVRYVEGPAEDAGITLRDLDEAIEKANSVPYGLAAYGFTNRADYVDRMIEGIEAGNVSINTLEASLPENSKMTPETNAPSPTTATT